MVDGAVLVDRETNHAAAPRIFETKAIRLDAYERLLRDEFCELAKARRT